MSTLIEKLRKSRQVVITVGDFTFFARRPTDAEAATMIYHSWSEAMQSMAYLLYDWSGVKESNIIADGTDSEVEFDSDLAADWLLDMPELWEPIVSGIHDAYDSHRKKQEAQGKS